ncbi:MAG TPA: hypothetical protein VIX86_11685 [Streptosporangiaceae bacterium]
MVAALAVALAACGSARPPAFHPAGANPSARHGPGAPGKLTRTSTLTWPPFGPDVHIIMPGWLPADPGEIPAVITAKNFLLAYLYAEYKGGADQRWAGYVAGSVATALRSDLAVPAVTTESFTGIIRFSRIQAFWDPSVNGAIDVSECFDNARSANVGLHSRRVIPDRSPPGQHYYRNTDVLARGAGGQWHVIGVYPVIYYPQAKECKP